MGGNVANTLITKKGVNIGSDLSWIDLYWLVYMFSHIDQNS